MVGGGSTAAAKGVSRVAKAAEGVVARERGGLAKNAISGVRSLLQRARSRMCSFTAGTQVLMCDGSLRAIEDVEEGEWVWARDDQTGELACQQVVDPYDNPNRSIILLTLQNADGQTEVIETTDNHPFYVEGRGWTRVDALHLGDTVPSSDGSQLTLVAAEWTDRIETVYNFGVEGFHTYFVGELGAWVHNCRHKTVLRRIRSWSRKPGGNTSVKGRFSDDEAIKLGRDFVGPNSKDINTKKGRILVSEDGLRQFRFPSSKTGIDTRSGQPWTSTGRQANFESRPQPKGRWTNNVHIEVKR